MSSPRRARLVVTGDELLRGFVDEANAGFLARELRHLGIELVGVHVTGDAAERIERSLRHAMADGVDDDGPAVDLVVVTGGLGPTHDDRTTEVVAAVIGRGLELREDALAAIEKRVADFAAARGIDAAGLLVGSRKQAMMPEGAIMLDPQGTAPGFVVPGAPVIVVLPGPPSELRYCWRQAVSGAHLAALADGGSRARERVLRTWGVPESRMAAALDAAGHEDCDARRVTLCARDGELELSIRGGDAEAIESLVARLTRAMGEHLFAVDDERPIAAIVGAALAARGETVGVAESCTAGMLGALLTEEAGSSRWFRGGVQCYADDVKVRLLDVDADLIANRGAVSAEVAGAMALGARAATDADWGVAITGIAGPGGGTAEKPVGTVHIAVSGAGDAARRLALHGDREAIRRRSCVSALHLLRERLATNQFHNTF